MTNRVALSSEASCRTLSNAGVARRFACLPSDRAAFTRTAWSVLSSDQWTDRLGIAVRSEIAVRGILLYPLVIIFQGLQQRRNDPPVVEFGEHTHYRQRTGLGI